MKTFREWLEKRIMENTPEEDKKDADDLFTQPPNPVAGPTSVTDAKLGSDFLKKFPKAAAQMAQLPNFQKMIAQVQNKYPAPATPAPMPAAPLGINR